MLKALPLLLNGGEAWVFCVWVSVFSQLCQNRPAFMAIVARGLMAECWLASLQPFTGNCIQSRLHAGWPLYRGGINEGLK